MADQYQDPVPLRVIAEKCGVSRTTVSRALRNDDRVAQATRAQVQAVARELGHHPDPRLEMLMTEIKRSQSRRFVGNLGVLWDHPQYWSERKDYDFIASLIRGAKQRAEDLGYSLDSITISDPGMTASRLDKIIYNRGIAGILIPPMIYKGQSFPELNWSRICVVSLTRLDQTKRFSSVQAHTSRDVVRLYDRIIERGYRRPGLVVHRGLESRRNNETISRYFYYCHEVLNIDPLPILEPQNKSEVQNWLDKHQPDLVIGPADWCYHALKDELRIKMPDELGYIGFVDDPDCGASGIHQRPKEIGAAGIDLLTAHISRREKGIPAFTKNVHIDSTLLEGSSIRRLR